MPVASHMYPPVQAVWAAELPVELGGRSLDAAPTAHLCWTRHRRLACRHESKARCIHHADVTSMKACSEQSGLPPAVAVQKQHIADVTPLKAHPRRQKTGASACVVQNPVFCGIFLAPVEPRAVASCAVRQGWHTSRSPSSFRASAANASSGRGSCQTQVSKCSHALDDYIQVTQELRCNLSGRNATHRSPYIPARQGAEQQAGKSWMQPHLAFDAGLQGSGRRRRRSHANDRLLHRHRLVPVAAAAGITAPGGTPGRPSPAAAGCSTRGAVRLVPARLQGSHRADCGFSSELKRCTSFIHHS